MNITSKLPRVGLTIFSDWDAFGRLISPKTRLVMLNFPHNPSGAVLTAQDLDTLAEILVDKKRDILAVQTLRNRVMASTFLASTAILISLGLVASTFRTEITSSATQTLNVFGHPSETLWIIKLFVLSALFFYAFFNFTLSIRYYNHAGLLINVPQDLEPSSNVDAVTSILNHGALHYTLGMRGFYLAIPLGLWLFGPFWMLGGSVLVVLVLYRLV
jgi:uncharacterized membrane protein